ncbi:hypothetical protein [Burkholderia vietnamiensis]|uniref:hypothetical protein n=1 Tax=Burkholderia vietnamiensis TaxID=60552 RepID=UPI0007540DCD|nr:hypothetical protein [Burkholderia vietnamiensis]KVR79130.1 hypothetical protein WK26_18210 [Burkholderia vietnamiensis]KVS29259.1 hypothetical protein WK35_13475 [Burkholderia vietnamiensis]MBR8358331.1 hypothetical protein [Burkholderia vietnamiensis]
MSKPNNDVLLIGGLALAAVFMMSRARPAVASTAGVARPVRSTGGLPWGFTGLPTGRVIGAITGGSNSPDLVAGAAPGGSTGGFFSTIDAVDNANAAVQSTYLSGLSGPVGLIPGSSSWLNSVGGAQSTFYLPDQVNAMQDPYAGFDNPNNYG